MQERSAAQPRRADGITPPSFKTGQELRQHYLAVKQRIRGGPLVSIYRPKPPEPPSEPIMVAPPPPQIVETPEGQASEEAMNTEPPKAVQPEQRVRCHDIIRAVSTASGFTVQELCSPMRYRNLVRARMVIYVLARRYSGCSLPQIGRFVGGRDHSTVLHGYKVGLERFREMLPIYRAACSAIGVPLPAPDPDAPVATPEQSQ